jgi:serine protease Do
MAGIGESTWRRCQLYYLGMKLFCWAGAVVLLSFCAVADTVKDREGAVRGDKAAMENDARWIYNDYKKGFERVKWEGKPLLVVLRCVPCLACAGIDASVLQEPELQPLLDKFVCVRVINANALDLSLFQFDYDLSFSAIFFNGDGTVYGRYGSWTHQKSPQDKTTAGFKKAMQGVLSLHKQYPSNKASLAGKQGVALPFKDPVEIPQLAGKYKRDLDWQGKVVQSCVHCHMVGDAIRSYYRAESKHIPMEWIYPWPAPETIGLTLATEESARVEEVTAGSIAEKAGLKKGDEMMKLNGQPLTSIADVSWVLHNAPDSGALEATIFRDGNERALNIELPKGWRMKSDISRRVGTWEMRAMALGGLFIEDLSADERAKRNLPKDSMALFVKHAGEYGIHAAAKKAGFKKDDVIVSVDGNERKTSESELIGELLQKHVPGDQVKAVVMRERERIDLMLPIQ